MEQLCRELGSARSSSCGVQVPSSSACFQPEADSYEGRWWVGAGAGRMNLHTATTVPGQARYLMQLFPTTSHWSGAGVALSPSPGQPGTAAFVLVGWVLFHTVCPCFLPSFLVSLADLRALLPPCLHPTIV